MYTSPTHPEIFAHARAQQSTRCGVEEMAEWFGVSVSRDVLRYGLLASIGGGALAGGLYWLAKRLREASTSHQTLNCFP